MSNKKFLRTPDGLAYAEDSNTSLYGARAGGIQTITSTDPITAVTVENQSTIGLNYAKLKTELNKDYGQKTVTDQLVTDVNDHDGKIRKNTQDIVDLETRDDALENRIVQNEADINTHRGDINQNTTDIQTNLTKINTNKDDITSANTQINLRVKKTDYITDKAEISADLGLKANTTYVNTEINKVNTEIADVRDQIKTQSKIVGEIVVSKTYKQYEQGWVGVKWYMALKDNVNGDVTDTDNWRPMNAPQQTVDLSNYNTIPELDAKLALKATLATDNIFTGINQFTQQIVIDQEASQPAHPIRKAAFDAFKVNNTTSIRRKADTTYVNTQLATKANDNEVVKVTGTQTIADQKTFTSSIKLSGSTMKVIGTGVLEITAPYETRILSDNSNIVLNSSGSNKVVSSRIPIDMNNNKIQRVADPTDNTDAVNLQYFNANKGGSGREITLGDEFDTGLKLGTDKRTVWERWIQVGDPYASTIVKVASSGDLIGSGINQFLGITMGVIRRNSGNTSQYQLHNINAITNAPDQHASIVYQDDAKISYWFNPSMTLSHFKDSPFFIVVRYTKV